MHNLDLSAWFFTGRVRLILLQEDYVADVASSVYHSTSQGSVWPMMVMIILFLFFVFIFAIIDHIACQLWVSPLFDGNSEHSVEVTGTRFLNVKRLYSLCNQQLVYADEIEIGNATVLHSHLSHNGFNIVNLFLNQSFTLVIIKLYFSKSY